MMQWSNAFRVAWRAIRTNKTRSLLTMLGVIIGVGSVILLTSIGTGLQTFIEEQFEALGSNTIVVYPFQVFNESGGFSDADEQVSSLNAAQFRERDIKALSKNTQLFAAVMPEASRQEWVNFRSISKKATIVGTYPNYQEVRSTYPQEGRFFTNQETDAGTRVAVLGSKIADEVFGNIDPINKKIRLGGGTYTVVGVAEEKGGGFGGPSFDNYIFVPLQAYFRQFDTEDIGSISIKTRTKEGIDSGIAYVEEYFINEDKRKADEFEVFDQRQILDTINQVLGVLTVGLGGIAAISLVVGGIGIMNIMLVSVTERTREIGLRKALGATPRQIMIQFLIEASLLSVLGGLIGVVIAAALSLAIRVLADFPSMITLNAVALAFGVSMAVGVIFGVAPARKASKLSPIEALRSE